MYQDETLVCRDCGKEFIFSASEQAFYAEKGFQNKPRRCPECRAAFRAANGNARPQREMFTAICADCGKETQVPFQPRGDKPVYCRDCFAAQRPARRLTVSLDTSITSVSPSTHQGITPSPSSPDSAPISGGIRVEPM